jgi:hypothetical protein
MTKGWKRDSGRHKLARSGVKTKVEPQHFGSQTREKIENTDEGYTLVSIKRGEAILYNPFTKEYEAWFKNDDHAGYTIEIHGIGYEFAHSFPKGYIPK